MATKKIVFWDSDIFITWMNPEEELKKPDKCEQHHIDAIDQMASLMDSGELIIVTSSLTRVEVLAGDVPPAATEKFNKFWQSDTFEIVSPDERVVEKAHDIRNFYKQHPNWSAPKNFDSVQMATAIHYGCEFLFTFDGSGKKNGMIAYSGTIADKWSLTICTPNLQCLGYSSETGSLFQSDSATEK